MPVQLCLYMDPQMVDTTSVGCVMEAAKGRLRYRQLMHFVLFAELSKAEDAPVEVANWVLLGRVFFLG